MLWIRIQQRGMQAICEACHARRWDSLERMASGYLPPFEDTLVPESERAALLARITRPKANRQQDVADFYLSKLRSWSGGEVHKLKPSGSESRSQIWWRVLKYAKQLGLDVDFPEGRPTSKDDPTSLVYCQLIPPRPRPVSPSNGLSRPASPPQSLVAKGL